MILWLRESINHNQIDNVIRAELPYPELINSNLILVPCGDLNTRFPSMVDKKCTKNFPKDFIKETKMHING